MVRQGISIHKACRVAGMRGRGAEFEVRRIWKQLGLPRPVLETHEPFPGHVLPRARWGSSNASPSVGSGSASLARTGAGYLDIFAEGIGGRGDDQPSSPLQPKQTRWSVCRSGRAFAGNPHDGDAAGERPHPNFRAPSKRAQKPTA